jgi:hypothetical protein
LAALRLSALRAQLTAPELGENVIASYSDGDITWAVLANGCCVRRVGRHRHDARHDVEPADDYWPADEPDDEADTEPADDDDDDEPADDEDEDGDGGAAFDAFVRTGRRTVRRMEAAVTGVRRTGPAPPQGAIGRHLHRDGSGRWARHR